MTRLAWYARQALAISWFALFAVVSAPFELWANWNAKREES